MGLDESVGGAETAARESNRRSGSTILEQFPASAEGQVKEWGILVGGDSAGAALPMGRSGKLKISGLAFSGRRARVLEAQGPPVLAMGGSPSGAQRGAIDSLLALGGSDLTLGDHAYSYRVGYEGARFGLTGTVQDVGGRYTSPAEMLNGASESDTAALRAAAGTRNIQMNATWQLAPSTSLASSYETLRNDKLGDKKRGLTASKTSHALAFNISPGSKLKASLTNSQEEWDRTLRKPGAQRQESKLEFESAFGGGQHALRLALTSLTNEKGGERNSQGTSEAHLKLQPTKALQLTADYTAKSGDNGQDESTRAWGAVMQLGAGSRLQAGFKTVEKGSGGTGREESDLQLTTGLGGGTSRAELHAKQTLKQMDGADKLTATKLAFKGGLGRGDYRTAVTAQFEQTRAGSPTGQLSQKTGLHLDQGLGRGWKLIADHAQMATGTNELATNKGHTAVVLSGQLLAKTLLTTRMEARTEAGEQAASMQDVSLQQELGPIKLEVGSRFSRAGAGSGGMVRYAAQIPMGAVPEWANNISRAHEFADAYEYLTPREPDWLEAPFAGTRLLAARRRGLENGGRDTTGISHGLVISGRYYLQFGYQACPEVTSGDKKGQLMEGRRQIVMLGAPVGGGLVGRGWFLTDKSLSDPGASRSTVGLSLWGKLAGRDQAEATVSHSSGDWEAGGRDQSTVSVLYGRQVSDEDRVNLKVGYSWGKDSSGDQGRECRFRLGYDKPI